MKFTATPVAIAIALLSSSVWANNYSEELNDLANDKIRALIETPTIINEINSQNKKNAALTQSDIDQIDMSWRNETEQSTTPFIDSALSSSLSIELKSLVEEQQGLFTEIFVMDDKGLNVGQSGITSDYWQGDEAKWQQTFLLGPDAVHISDVEFDESSQTYQAQVSISITDPQSGKAIGAATFGVNADAL